MRRLAGVAISFALLVAFAAVALAGEATSPSGQIQALGVTHSSGKASTKKRHRGVFATVTVQLRKADGAKPSATTGAKVHIPKGMKLGYRHFAKCDPAKLQARGVNACPKRSKVGSGSIKADARPVVNETVGGSVTAFNGKYENGKPTYLLYVIPQLSTPVLLVGRLLETPSGSLLEIAVPPVPTLPGQPSATLTDLTVRTGGRIRKTKRVQRRKAKRVDRRKTRRVRRRKRKVTYNYLENPRRCGGNWRWSIDFTYANGETLSPIADVPCKE